MNIPAEFRREQDGRWVAEIPELPGTLAYGSTRHEAAIGASVRAFQILAERIESGELRVQDESGAITLGGSAESLSELLAGLEASHSAETETIAANEELERDAGESFSSAEEQPAAPNVANVTEESESLAASSLPALRTVADYYRLRDMLDGLVEKVGDDESHPLAGFMNRVATLLEQFENTHLPEIIESKQNR